MPPLIELPSQDEMLRAVGRGIQAFANVEVAVGFLFADLMEPADRGGSIIALDAAGPFATKTRMLDALAKHRLSAGVFKTFSATLKQCDDVRIFRNILAHWTVGYWPGAATVEEAKRQKVVLAPPPSSPKWGPTIWGDEPPIHLNQIEEFIQKCQALFADLLALSNTIKSAP